MTSKFPGRAEYLLVGAVLVGALLVAAVLPVSLFGSGLIVTAVVLTGSIAVVPGAWPTLYRKTGVGPAAWLLAMGIAAGGVALSYLVGNPQPFCEGIGHRGCLTAYGITSTVYVGSTLGVAIAAGHLGRYRRIRAASRTPAGEVIEGPVAVEGRVTPLGGPVDGPVSGEPTVWYRCVRETPTVFNGYRERDSETVGDQFYVEDGSGRLLVAPEGIDSHDAAEHARAATEAGEEQRRREWHFRPQDAVTLVGHATAVSRADYPDSPAVGVDGPVLLSTRSLDELRGWAARRAVGGGVLAFGVGGLSLVGMLLTA